MKNKSKSILAYLKPYWGFAILAPLAMIFEVLIDLLQPKLMALIVDEGVLGGNLQLIWMTGLKMLGLVILGGLCGAASAGFGSATAQNFGCDLRKDVFYRTMHLSHQQTDKFTTGSLVTRLTNDVTMIQDMVNFSLRMLVRTLMQFVGGIIMMLSLDISFSTILFITLPIQVLLIILMMKKVSPLFTVIQKKLDGVNTVVQENATGARMVKAYNREKYEIKRFNLANDDLVNVNLKVQKIFAILMPVLMGLMYGATVALLSIGGRNVELGRMQVGQVMAATTYITQILMSMMMIGFMIQGISRAQASLKRVREVLDSYPAIQPGDKVVEKGAGSVRFENVSFNYPSALGRPVLQDISFEVNPGETVAILGATGSGKSTLVNLIPRFYDVTEGNVFVDGVNVKEYEMDSLRNRIGFVLQKSELFSGTVEENIRWGTEDATEEDVKKAARIAQAEEFITQFQDGYNTMITEKGSSLSGGQKQRISIARALLRKPEIIIFDDSTSALDLATEARLQQALRTELSYTTVIKIAQRVASVMSADKIAVLDDGKLVDFAPHDVLMQRCDIYKDIVDSQLGKGDVSNE